MTVTRICFVLAVAACLATSSVAAAGNVAAADGGAPVAVDVEGLVGRIGSTQPKAERLAAALELEKLGALSVDAVAAKLGDLRKAPPAGVPAAVEQARKAAGREGDLLDALLSLDRGDETAAKLDPAAIRHAAMTLALARALANAGTTPAARALVRVAGDSNGAYRIELARIVKRLGERAIPALLETRKDGTAAVRAWAYSQLEAMGKRIPADAVQTKEPEVLVDVLRAYARIGDLDALPVILSFVNADKAQVRTAAREAVVSYGPEAIWKVREAYANVAGKPAAEGATIEAVAKELFATYDRLRLQEVYGLFDQGLRAEKEGKLDEAVATFDKVLARQPMLDRRAEAAPVYVAKARAVMDADPNGARALFEKARRLAPESAFVPQIDAELAYLDGKDLLARGIVDEAPFRRALERDPGHPRARAELARIDEQHEGRANRVRAFGGAFAVLVVGIVAAILFGGFRRRPRARA